MKQSIKISIENVDATKIKADVLTLKYAQERFGLDAFVYQRLLVAGVKESEMSPKPGEFSIVSSSYEIAAGKVLFLGTPRLRYLGYTEIRNLGRAILITLTKIISDIKSVIVTMHGVGYGLDEAESFESQIAGFIDAIKTGEVPETLECIIFAERNVRRVQRIKKILEILLPNGLIDFDKNRNIKNVTPDTSEKLRSVGHTSNSKKHVFVAMPFREEMEDLYDYGISSAVREAGFLCERADLSSFTGDVMQWVRERIRSASFVIADLSDSNPNVYLEVGYAWGSGVPTILLASETEKLKFDVRGQRCIVYKRIKDIEEKLRKEIKELIKIKQE
ncbi:MAG: hypothetical protein ABFD82_10640 [Syntrophaceae bacterium]